MMSQDTQLVLAVLALALVLLGCLLRVADRRALARDQGQARALAVAIEDERDSPLDDLMDVADAAGVTRPERLHISCEAAWGRDDRARVCTHCLAVLERRKET